MKLPSLNPTAPPPTFPTVPSTDPDCAHAPAPDIFVLPPTEASGNLPPPPPLSEAAIHLLLLEVFWTLQQRVDPAEWPRFLDEAVRRFEIWWPAALGESTEVSLPPLDVLLVWHSYLLNPGKYERDVKSLGMGKVLNAMFPWNAIRNAVNVETLEFSLPDEAARAFHNIIGDDEDVDLVAQRKNRGEGGNSKHSAGGCDQCVPAVGEKRALDDAAAPRVPSICLSAAVTRQGSFIQKMHHLLWLRSPCLTGTLNRAQLKYTRFFELFQAHPGTTLVPTLDIDLFWHTSQLCAAKYRRFCEARAGRFINHDDTIESDKLEDGFGNTRLAYGDRFKEDYGGCLCWACEQSRDNAHLQWWRWDFERAKWEGRVRVEFCRAVERARTTDLGVANAGLKTVMKRKDGYFVLQEVPALMRRVFLRGRYGKRWRCEL